jgi:hypothetical protein
MASFTGPEIAALIDAGCIITSHEAFSQELQSQLQSMPPYMRHRTSYEHWIYGVYLITQVSEDDGCLSIPVETESMLGSLRDRFGNASSITLQGRRYRLAAREALDGCQDGELREALARQSAPCVIAITAEEPTNCGNDHVVAVNLTRVTNSPPQPDEVQRAVARVCARYKGAAQVEITHFLGGPCDDDDIMACIVLGGGGQGWTVLKDLESALELAHSRAVKRGEVQGEIAGGQTVRLMGLKAAPELNGEVALALRFDDASGRWLVRLRNGEGKRLKPANLEPLEGAKGRVFCVWGDARWSRAQLLGEIAKGDWGLCRANTGDLTTAPAGRWANMEGRLAFAPITEMTESYMREAHTEMVAARATAQMHNPQPSGDEGEE